MTDIAKAVEMAKESLASASCCNSVPLARALLAVMPVVEAAQAWHAAKCERTSLALHGAVHDALNKTGKP